MKLARKVEIQPTPTQRRSLLQHAGNARWAYNWGLARKQAAWAERKAALDAGVSKDKAPKVPTAIDLHRELCTLKKIPKEDGGIPWMYAASKSAPQESLRDLDRAFLNFFRRVQNGERPGYPRFKSRSQGIGGFRLTGAIHANERVLHLPRLGGLRIKPGNRGYIPKRSYAQAHVTERAGRWYVSVLDPEERMEAVPNGGQSVGIDLGVVRLATLSDGTVIENPRAFASAVQQIRRRQKDLSRKQRGSSNQKKARLHLARAHARVANIRQDATHKATTAIAKRYGRIVIEDLCVRDMTRATSGQGRAAKAGLNRSVLDAAFGEFRRQLEYKGRLYGCEIIVVPAPYTSQTCSACGCVDAESRRSQSEFACVRCGHKVNADLNAAFNILAAGSCPEAQNACGGDVRRVAPLSSDRERSQTSEKQESAVA